MLKERAIKMLPIYAAAEEPVRVYEPKSGKSRVQSEKCKGREPGRPEEKRTDRFTGIIHHAGEALRDGFRRKFGILLIGMALFCIWTVLLSAGVEHRTEKRIRAELDGQAEAAAAQAVEQYKAEQAEQVQAQHFLSGEASREAFVNQEIDAAARLAAKMGNDTQKGGIICNALARVMNKYYPGTMQEVVEQPQQWMFYDAANKFSAHDREIAEKILRAYYEDGIIPNGLTDEYVYGSWSENDYVLRNTWDFNNNTRTWRFQG